MRLTRRSIVLASALVLGLLIALLWALPVTLTLWQEGSDSRALDSALTRLAESPSDGAARLGAARKQLPTEVDSSALLSAIAKASASSQVSVSAGEASTSSIAVPTLIGDATLTQESVTVSLTGSSSEVGAFIASVTSAKPLTQVSTAGLEYGPEQVTGTITVSTYSLISPQAVGQQ